MAHKTFFCNIATILLLCRWGGHAFQPVLSTSTKFSSHSTRSICIFSEDDGNQGCSTTSANFAMDPSSPEANRILQQHLGLTDEQCKKLKQLSSLIVEWNDRVNLVSRKDCTESVVFGRHILPCLAPLMVTASDGDDLVMNNNQRVVDVGTGGGFPGLPLAIAYPDSNFLLVDSVGKKLKAVQNIADRLGLRNLKTHHGRAEDLLQEKRFDICVGRSVAAIPKYCLWIQHLLKPRDGKLLYLIGGDIEQGLLSETVCNVDIDQLLDHPGVSDKKILVFPQESVTQIALSTGEKLPRRQGQSKSKSSKQKSSTKRKKAKGQWSNRTPEAPKQRGYDGFQRYDSTL